MPTISIDARFNGPPNSGNGGYVCGSVAVAASEFVDHPLSVSLRVPPPLDRPYVITTNAAGDVVALDGDTVVATTQRFTGVHQEPPRVVTVAEAEDAATRFLTADEHMFPTCWVCGPARPPDDGLHLYPGPVLGSSEGLVAAPWVPSADIDAGDGTVAVQQVWAALDCPSYFGAAPENVAVLGALAIEQRTPVAVGEQYVAISWRTAEQDGRKIPAGSAVLTADGEIAALATALWIELTEEQSVAMTANMDS